MKTLENIIPNGTEIQKSWDWTKFTALIHNKTGKGETLQGAVEELNDMINTKNFLDWDMWCSTRKDFVNLQESNAWFGKTEYDSFLDLKKAEKLSNNQ